MRFSLNPYIELMRPINSLMSGAASIIGFLVASGFVLLPSHIVKLLLLFISAFLFSSASMAINDYFDREIDLVNQPNRPIPSGRVKPRNALLFSIITMIIGLSLSILITLEAFLIAIGACVVFTAYSAYLKKLGIIGNVAVSLCVALTFIYGSAALGMPTMLIVMFSIMAFLANMSREIIKGIIDVEGDKLKGVKTLAASCGFRAAAIMAFAFMVSAIVVSFMPIIYDYVNWLYMPVILASDAGLIASAALTLITPSPERARLSKKVMLVFMGLALIAFVIGCIRM